MNLTKDEKIQHALFYSQIAFAMNAARIIKSFAVWNPKVNQTQFQICVAANTSMIVNSAKIWDKSNYSIFQYIHRKDISEVERNELSSKLLLLEKKHNNTIEGILQWRHELVAHLNKAITVDGFNSFNGDLADIQSMLHDIAKLIESTSWYPEKKKPFKFLDYDQIRSDLKL